MSVGHWSFQFWNITFWETLVVSCRSCKKQLAVALLPSAKQSSYLFADGGRSEGGGGANYSDTESAPVLKLRDQLVGPHVHFSL